MLIIVLCLFKFHAKRKHFSWTSIRTHQVHIQLCHQMNGSRESIEIRFWSPWKIESKGRICRESPPTGRSIRHLLIFRPVELPIAELAPLSKAPLVEQSSPNMGHKALRKIESIRMPSNSTEFTYARYQRTTEHLSIDLDDDGILTVSECYLLQSETDTSFVVVEQ